MLSKRLRPAIAGSLLLMLVLAACGTPAPLRPKINTAMLMLPTRDLSRSTPTVIASPTRVPSSTAIPATHTPTTEPMHMDDADNHEKSEMQMDMKASVSGDPSSGKILFEKGNGNPAVPACISCHNVDSEEVKVGPSLAEIGHHGAEHAEEHGQTVDEFLREAIVEPNHSLMEDPNHVFAINGVSLMYQNYGKDLTEQEINDLIAYLVTLK